MARVFSMFIVIVLLAGCATPLQIGGPEVTVEEQRLDADTFGIAAQGQPWTALDAVERQALRHGAELALETGFDSFVVEARAAEYVRRTRQVAGFERAEAVRDYIERSEFSPGSAERFLDYTPPRTATDTVPRVELVIRAVQGPAPAGEGSYDARTLLQDIPAE